MFKYFTISEANATLPEINEKFKKALEIRNEITMIEKRIQVIMTDASIAQSETYSDNRHLNPLKTYIELKQKLNSAVTRLYHTIELIESMGVSLKGLDEGLVDFPSKRFDKDVWLCWKFGETEIKFWHDMDNGFMGRKPIEVNDESLV